MDHIFKSAKGFHFVKTYMGRVFAPQGRAIATSLGLHDNVDSRKRRLNPKQWSGFGVNQIVRQTDLVVRNAWKHWS
jgi:hypothetical protein